MKYGMFIYLQPSALLKGMVAVETEGILQEKTKRWTIRYPGRETMFIDLSKDYCVDLIKGDSLLQPDGLIPKLCGLPKIHKQNVPLRSIVSFVGSPTITNSLIF